MALRILVLGGTQFVGRSIVEKLLEDPGHSITLFNRGISNLSLFPRLDRIKGNRNEPADLEQIFGQHWDVVIDCSGYMPHSVKEIVHRIDTDQYIFISTVSVYDLKQFEQGAIHEDFPLNACSVEQRLDTSMKTYGERKAECDREIIASGINYMILRPSIIFGPYDHTDRLYYWYYRVKNELDFILPDTEEITSITYMDDLSKMVTAAMRLNPRRSVLNAATLHIKLKDIINEMTVLTGRHAKASKLPPEKISELELRPWSDLPYYRNDAPWIISDELLFETLDVECTPLHEALKHTLSYFDALARKPKYGLDTDRESKLLKTS